MNRLLLLLLCLLTLLSCGKLHTVPPVPSTVFPTDSIDSLVNAAVAESKIPGAVVCIVEDDHVAFLQAYGYRQVWPDTLPMLKETQFDLASLSKIVGTGMSLMTLVEQGRVDVNAPIRAYLPEYETNATVRDYLTHTSGMPAYAQYKTLLDGQTDLSAANRKQLLYHHMAKLRRRTTPQSAILAQSNDSTIQPFNDSTIQPPFADTADCNYSCLNFISLQHVVEKVSGLPLNEYAYTYVWKPLGMTHTCYYPLRDLPDDASQKQMTAHHQYIDELIVAPTERIAHTNACYLREVHDPLANQMMSGVSGNAGVFSTADDLAKMAIWMLNADKKGYKGPFSAELLQTMITVPEGYEKYGRALAWDVDSDYSWCKGVNVSKKVVCHTGYTGTSFVVDFEKRLALIVLTNRAHPNDGGGVSALRHNLANLVFGSK